MGLRAAYLLIAIHLLGIPPPRYSHFTAKENPAETSGDLGDYVVCKSLGSQNLNANLSASLTLLEMRCKGEGTRKA